MRRIALLIISFSMLLSFGCASKDYVRQQMEPLVERISKLEANKCCEKAAEAASRAEAAAEKAGKAFELQQKK